MASGKQRASRLRGADKIARAPANLREVQHCLVVETAATGKGFQFGPCKRVLPHAEMQRGHPKRWGAAAEHWQRGGLWLFQSQRRI